ncbi:eukaryotic translation initiation factor 4B1 [Olea europaea subsp. europaea]|uniref:Eukaryotic translation initiation factor 4B1 n=1 Tax=Olea europaea subsp. europaea TaxID=158383 RepID=A0A8S0QWB9_OLEEU|nr:eukaryotic translation initiation factor 4B1 [Olea europaea subsp. europaea]
MILCCGKKALAPLTLPKHQPQTKPAAAAGSAKLPSKPLPPAQAVKEERSESARGCGGRGYGHGYNTDSINNGNSYGNVEISGGQGESGEVDAKKPFERRVGYGGSKSNPFGAARPREEVLAEKGLDWKKMDMEIEVKKQQHSVSSSRPTSSRSSRPGSTHSSRSESLMTLQSGMAEGAAKQTP